MVNKLTLLGFKGGDHSNRPPPGPALAGGNRIINFCRQTNRKRHG